MRRRLDPKLRRIAELPWAARLPRRELVWLVRVGDVFSVPAGRVLHATDLRWWVHVVLAGTVLQHDGGRLHELRAGDTLSSGIAAAPSALAATEVSVLVLPVAALSRLRAWGLRPAPAGLVTQP